jgi:hypothetical protein
MKYKIMRCGETTFPNTLHKLHHTYRCLKVHGKTRVLVYIEQTRSKLKHISLAKCNKRGNLFVRNLP